MYEVGVFSDLYKVGTNEEGRDAISERYFVMIEAPDGGRWNHLKYFNGSEAKFDEEEGLPFFPDNRQEAKDCAEALAETVRKHLAKGGEINFNHWNRDRSRYGSEAYQANHEECENMLHEREQDRFSSGF